MGRHIFMALLILFLIPLFHAVGTEIKVSSPSFSSHDFDVFIEINSSIGLKGAQCDFSFNSSIVQVESVENGNMFNLWGGNFSNLPIIDNENGTIRDIVAFSTGDSSLKGIFAIIHFKVINEGQSWLNIENALLSDENANAVESVSKNASIIVDTSPPKIKNVEVNFENGKVNITCDVTEAYIKNVKLNITHLGETNEFDMVKAKQKYFFEGVFEKGNYSFFIIAEDMAGNENSSVIHKFSIKNHPPAKPYNPTPANGAINVAVTANLSWECYDVDNDSIKYDIYFGTSTLQKVKSNMTERTYSPSLEYSTTYYWRVVAWDEYGAKNESELWHFTTMQQSNSPPYIEIKYPIDGATVEGQIRIEGIAWDEDGNETIERVEMRIDDGAWVIANGTNSWSYGIDTTKLSNGQHKIEARAYDGFLYSDIVSIKINVENIKYYTLFISVYPSNAGYVTKSPSKNKYEEGSIVTLTASPKDGYAFDHWGGDASGSSPTIQIKMDENKSIVANFVFSKPSVDFSYEPSLPYAGEEVQFHDKSNAGEAWYWDFGDGSVATEQNPKHVYAKAGKYNVTLTIIIDGKEYVKKKSINVIGKEKADFEFYPLFPSPGSTIHFYASGKNIVSYLWDFGDGSYGYGKNVSHVYGEGIYFVRLHIKDGWGNEDNESKELHVEYPDFSINEVSNKIKKGRIIIDVTLENTGGDADNVTVIFYLNGKEIKRESIDIHHGNQSFEKDISIEEGKNEIKIFVDADNKFKEKNESNNIVSFIVYGGKNFPFNYIYLAFFVASVALISAYLLKFKRKEIVIADIEQEARCTVCFGKFKPNSDIIRCECGAMFHRSCAERVKTCPNCGRRLI